MGDETAELDEVQTQEEDPGVTDSIESEEKQESPEEGTEEGTPKDQEFEVVREAGESQPPKQQQHFGIRKRINKLNARVETARQQTTEANTENALLYEKNKILEIALQQAREAQPTVKQPDPSNFDEGYADPKYQEQQNLYQQTVIQSEVAKQVAESTKSFTQSTDQSSKSRDLERKQLKHYERAAEIGAKDYAAVEDKAIEVLGNETVNHLINTFDDSQVLLYYLGKNPHEAERIAGLINSNPILGIAEIGTLRSELRIKPKNKITPNPDKPLPGGSPAGLKNSDAVADKLLDKATKSGSKADLDKFFEHQDKRRKAEQKAGVG